MTLGLDAWVGIAMIALPLFGKLIMDVAGHLTANHNSALARITGMAAREAGTIARALTAQPAGSGRSLENALIARAVDAVLAEMDGSAAMVGANADKVKAIIQGEIDKLMATVTAPVVPLAERIQAGPLVPRMPANVASRP